MHLFYLDESGGVEETDQEHYVLGGISAEEKRPYYISKELDALQSELLPGITDPIEFHASHIRNGNGHPWDSMARKDREKILHRVYHKIANTPESVVLFGVAYHKPSFSGGDPIQKTCEQAAGHFDAYLLSLELKSPKEKERGLMIFDESNHKKTLHALLEQYRKTGASFGKIGHLAEIPLFTDSRLTRMMQLADFVAYAVFRRYEHGDSSYLDIILPKFQQSGGKLHGLMHLNANRDGCYCPACITRRRDKVPVS